MAKGVSANLLKRSSKRRRTLAEIRADKARGIQKEAEELARNHEIHALRLQVQQLQENAKTGALATDMMSQFIDAGLVEHNNENEFIVHGSHGDREFKASKKKQ